MAVPRAHLLRYKRGDELTPLVEELVTLTPEYRRVKAACARLVEG